MFQTNNLSKDVNEDVNEAKFSFDLAWCQAR